MLRRLASLPAVLAAALAAGCGTGLVDQDAGAGFLLGQVCSEGQGLCGGACVTEDAAHCGATCADCTQAGGLDPHASPICAAHACALACAPGWLRSGTTCQRATAVTAGFAHTCALLADGAVLCWGANEHGQLGDGTFVDRSAPVAAGLPGPASAIGAGYVHTCAVVAGEVWCWGDDSTGDLGVGGGPPRPTPVHVDGLTGVSAVAAGGGENAGMQVTYYAHTCALLGSGEVWCWGGNESGQLGDGTFTPHAAPTQAVNLPAPATALTAGDRHTCAVEAGDVRCWGANGASQLGNGGTSNQAQPVRAVQSTATAVAAGAAHTCAVAAGALLCWGSNSEGQADGGVNTAGTVPTPSPQALPQGTPAPSAVAAGRAHTCALAPDQAGGLVCFGGNASGQLGAPVSARGLVTVPLEAAGAAATASAVTAGYDHTCALLSDGAVACWGANGRGQLGGGAAGAAVAAPALVSGR